MAEFDFGLFSFFGVMLFRHFRMTFGHSSDLDMAVWRVVSWHDGVSWHHGVSWHSGGSRAAAARRADAAVAAVAAAKASSNTAKAHPIQRAPPHPPTRPWLKLSVSNRFEHRSCNIKNHQELIDFEAVRQNGHQIRNLREL